MHRGEGFWSIHAQYDTVAHICINCTRKAWSVCGTWIYRLLPALHAHLPCTTLLNSEECALSEKKKKEEKLLNFCFGMSCYQMHNAVAVNTAARRHQH